MGHTCIGIAALLISLTAGMFLLAQTKKDNLGVFHSVISWFVIVLSLGCILCCGIRCVIGGCHGGMRQEREVIINGEGCDKKMFHHRNGPHKMMRMEMRGGDCCKMNEGCMENGTMDCCKGKEESMKMDDCCKMKKGMKCEMDTAIVKKK